MIRRSDGHNSTAPTSWQDSLAGAPPSVRRRRFDCPLHCRFRGQAESGSQVKVFHHVEPAGAGLDRRQALLWPSEFRGQGHLGDSKLFALSAEALDQPPIFR